MKLILFFSALILVTSCSNSAKTNTNGTPVEMINNPATANNPTAQPSEFPIFSFESSDHDFGELIAGQIVETTYKFTNTGKANLIITDYKVSCGCTKPEYPKEPVKPGESGTVKVRFDSSGKSGIINKDVTLICNTKEQSYVLHFKANVRETKE